MMLSVPAVVAESGKSFSIYMGNRSSQAKTKIRSLP
jgi:hypothetical protein